MCAWLAAYGPALAKGAVCRGRCGGSFQSMLREMVFWTNLYIFQVREVEPRKTTVCPGSQDIFTHSSVGQVQISYFFNQSLEKKN